MTGAYAPRAKRVVTERASARSGFNFYEVGDFEGDRMGVGPGYNIEGAASALPRLFTAARARREGQNRPARPFSRVYFDD